MELAYTYQTSESGLVESLDYLLRFWSGEYLVQRSGRLVLEDFFGIPFCSEGHQAYEDGKSVLALLRERPSYERRIAVVLDFLDDTVSFEFFEAHGEYPRS